MNRVLEKHSLAKLSKRNFEMFNVCYREDWASLVAQRLKRLPATQETLVRSLGQEETPGERNVNLFQCSYLENPMDGGAWWVTVHGVSKSGHVPWREELGGLQFTGLQRVGHD